MDDEEGSGEITDDESVDLIQPATRLEALLEAAGKLTLLISFNQNNNIQIIIFRNRKCSCPAKC